MGKSQRKKADEAYLRLFGQTDLEEQIEQVAAQEARTGPISAQAGAGSIETVSVLPAACPECGEGVQTGRPYIWTHMLKRVDGPYRIQCGHCAHTLWVDEAVWKRVKMENAARFGRVDVKPVRKRSNKNERGLE